MAAVTQQRTYPHGVTCWIDTGQPDPEAAARFYSGLFGWTLTDAVPPGAPGSYLIATLDGQDVAAIAPGAGTPSWNTYVAVDDVDGWAVHPGGPRILDVVRDELGLTEAQIACSRRVLDEHGNCSSATVLLVLQELADVDGPVVAMAFGPGLTLYAALLMPA